jgi:hypothetical protein
VLRRVGGVVELADEAFRQEADREVGGDVAAAPRSMAPRFSRELSKNKASGDSRA